MAANVAAAGTGKTDMDRIGLFSEMGYVSIGDKYPRVHIYFKPFNADAYKNRQMLPGGSKSRTATQAGYFEKEFKRIMEKEAYSNYVVMRRQDRLRAKDKDLDGAFTPSSPGKLPSGLGSYYGTFSGVVDAFSPLTHPRKGYKPPGKNFLTNPGKKGTGYGYTNVLIGKMPEHSYDPYSAGRDAWSKVQAHHKKMLRSGEFKLNLYPLEYFDRNPYFTDKVFKVSMRRIGSEVKRKDFGPFKPSSPGKKMGGCKAGSFGPYPTHSTDPYKVKKKLEPTRNKYGKIYLPNSGPKSRPISSIITTNVNRSVNIDNYKTIKRVTDY